MNTTFKKMLEISRKLNIDRFAIEDEYIIGGYDLVQKMPQDEWIRICQEINSVFLKDIDKNEYYNSDYHENPPFNFCVKSDCGDYYFEDITLSFLKKKNLTMVTDILEMSGIPYILKEDHVEIKKSALKNDMDEILIHIVDSTGDSDGLDAFQYIASGGVDYCTIDSYHLIEEISKAIDSKYLNNSELLIYDKEEQCLIKRKTPEELNSILEMNRIPFSNINHNHFLITLNSLECLKLYIDENNCYKIIENDSEIKSFVDEVKLIEYINQYLK